MDLLHLQSFRYLATLQSSLARRGSASGNEEGGFAAFESTDGRALYYRKDGDYGIWKMSLPNGEETRILPIGLDWGQWSVLDNGIYFIGINLSSRQFVSSIL